MMTKDTLDRLVELGSKSVVPVQAGTNGEPFVVVPSSTKVESLAHLLPPTRIKQRVTLLEAGSFSDYVNRFKTGNTLIFAAVSESGARFVAILDYHGAAPELKPDRCDHMATFATAETPEWRTWCAANRKPMSQVEFANWLEDNQQLFREPTGAALLELIQTLSGKSDVRFNSAVRLQSGGNRLHFDEDVELRGQTTTGEGDVELPASIMAAIAPFQGGQLYEVRARLKYRIESRKLALWYETIAMHLIVRDSILLLVKQISEKTGIVPLLGNV